LAAIALATAAAAAWVVVGHGFSRFAAATLVGSLVTLGTIGWMIGFDVHSLTWAWGAIGERQTEEILHQLDSAWHVEHDIARPHGGNWDHIVVGPSGVFLLDSKNLSRQAFADTDGLRSGRTCFRGAGFRAAASDLSATLAEATGSKPWVQPVVVIWGTFPQQHVQSEGVAYVNGDRVVPWLREQAPKLSPARVAALTDSLIMMPRRSPTPLLTVLPN
jgi:hypothetical protein